MVNTDKEIEKYLGPYLRKSDNRRFMVVKYTDGSKSTTLYSRYLMEQELDRHLDIDETVDHINGDVTDDRLENLRVIPRAEHVRQDNLGKPSPLKGIEKGWTHGTQYAWQKKGCRCDICKPVWREWNDKRNARRRKK